MKAFVIIGLIAGTVLSFGGYIAIFSGASEMEATGSWNALMVLGYVLLLPTMILGHLKQLTDFDNMTIEMTAMIIVQLAWYAGLAILTGRLIQRKNMRTSMYHQIPNQLLTRPSKNRFIR